MSLRRPTAALLIYLHPFWGVISDTRSLHSISILHIHILPTCVHHEYFFLSRDWPYDHRIFRSMITLGYIIPVFLMFASTFKRTHWLVPGYCLGQISRMERALRRQPRNPCKGDSSLAKIGVILVSCSCGKWSPIDADVSNRFRPQPLETKCCTPRPKWSCTTYFVPCLEFLYQVGTSSANSNPGAGEHTGRFSGNLYPKIRSWQTWYQSQADHWLILS